MESEVNGILVAAHELKAPLSILRQLAFSLDFADQKETSNIRTEMISVSERAIRQVNDLTKIAHLEDGLFEMEPVSVRAVCDDVIKELTYLFRFNNRDLKVKYSNNSRLVVANRNLLFSVIYNFCLNAVHYSTEETMSRLEISDHYDGCLARNETWLDQMPNIYSYAPRFFRSWALYCYEVFALHECGSWCDSPPRRNKFFC